MARQGIEGGKPALELAQKVSSSKRMTFEGFMAYSGRAAHTKGFEARKKFSMEVLSGVRESRDLAKAAGLPVNIMSGGSTGTYNIDHETGLTELESGTYVFMDTETFEQITLPGLMVGDKILYLRENDLCKITMHDGKPLDMELPQTVTLIVTETEPGIKGATAAAQTKPATLETGLKLQVPSFITEGELIVVQTEDGKYLRRAKEGK